MLDLNLEAESPNSSYCDETEPITAIGDDSGASNNFSTAGGAEEEYSNSSSRTDSFTTLNFSILNKNDNIIEIGDELVNDHQGLVTHQLFPVDGESSVVSRPQQYWLNLAAAPEPEGTALGLCKPSQTQTQPTPVKKSRRGPRSRSSQYRGVTFYRRTGRWESHIWDCGKQVYLGGFDTAHAAARAYDRAALKFRGVEADINFHINDYEEDMKQTKNLTKEEFIQVLRRQSNGFARGNSKYRGVAAMNKCGRWESRMGQLLGKKAYDVSALQCNGREIVNNFNGVIPGMATRDEKLDLNLWVSPPSAASSSFQYGGANKVLKVESSSSVPNPHGLRVAPNYPPTWSSMYSGLTLNNEERLNGNRTWNVPGPVPFFTSSSAAAAASSGFSSTNSHLQLIPNTMTRNPLFQHSPSPFNYNFKN